MAEALQPRELLAGLADCGPIGTSIASSPSEPLSALVAEGEPAMDLIAYAQRLADAGIVLYGAAWDAATTAQLAAFSDGASHVPLVDVGNPDRTLNQTAIDLGITELPTWVLPNGSRSTGSFSINQLVTLTGLHVPAGDQPTIAEIADQTVGIGSPLHIPVDAYDPGDGPVTITVTSSDPSILEATVVADSPSLRLTVASFGEMVYRLFSNEVPDAVARVTELVNSGFYDGLTIHRILTDHVIQFGDPTGLGAGGSALGSLDDQFDPNLQHNRPGVLSFAKTLDDDTANSQLYVAAGAKRELDYQFPIVGQLVEGEPVRQALDQVPNSLPGNIDPDYLSAFGPITITSAEIFSDLENGLLRLIPTGNAVGDVTVTVKATDASGLSFERSFEATVSPDDFQTGNNSKPYLGPVADLEIPAGERARLQLSATDIEGDPVVFETFNGGTTVPQILTDAATGEVLVTPPPGYFGTLELTVGVRAASSAGSAPPNPEVSDLQAVTITVDPGDALGLNLDAVSDTGFSDTDNITNANTASFTAGAVTPGATVELIHNATVLATQTASTAVVHFADVDISAITDGPQNFDLRHTLNGDETTLAQPLTLIIDRQGPAEIPLNAEMAFATRPIFAEITHPDQGPSLRYSVSGAPASLSIDAQTGSIDWTPQIADVGTHPMDVHFTDIAGNITTEPFSVEVKDPPQAVFTYQFTDTSGTPITEVAEGSEFLAQIFVADNRRFTTRHVFSAFLDVTFDNQLASLSQQNPITLGPNFGFVQSGTAGDGVIDELGAVSSVFNQPIQLLATLQFVADGRGTFVISGDPAEGLGHEVLMVDSGQPIPVDQIDYGRGELPLVKPPQPITLQFPTSIVADPVDQTVSSFVARPDVPGLLDIWMDLNGDGDFVDNGEQIINDLDLQGLEQVVPFMLPAGLNRDSLSVRYTLSAAGDLPISESDVIDGIALLESTVQNDLRVFSDGDVLDVTQVGDQVQIQQDGVTIYRSRGAGTLQISLADGDTSTTLADLSAALPSSDAISIQSAGGDDLVIASGFGGAIDLAGDTHLWRGIDALTILDETTLQVDALGIQTLGPSNDRIAVTIPADGSITALGDWRVESTSNVPQGFLRTLHSNDRRIDLLGGPTWTNPINALDVSNNGVVEPIDALIILNELTQLRFLNPATSELLDPVTLAAFPGRYYDTNEDGVLTPIDALRVINRLSVLAFSGQTAPLDSQASGESDDDELLHAESVDRVLAKLW